MAGAPAEHRRRGPASSPALLAQVAPAAGGCLGMSSAGTGLARRTPVPNSKGLDLRMVAHMDLLQYGAPTNRLDIVQALGLNGEEYDDSSPVVTGSQLSSRAMEEALKSVPEDAAQR